MGQDGMWGCSRTGYGSKQDMGWDGNRTEHGMGRWDRTGGPHSPAWCCPLLNTLASHNLEMKHLPGADPELVLLSYRYEELERIPLSDMTREEINQLVQELGFYRKETPDAPVPEEFQFAPAKPLPTLQLPKAPATDSKTPSEHDNKEHPDL
uniref:Selenoprotein M n=1 Tax=Anser cygnoides TaxID=8845 RepID=A0A8B9DP06_ANSCY|nr:selenoprotein M [Anser cygnoides]XP_013054413.1 selenoprotein M [Anser cygnoides]